MIELSLVLLLISVVILGMLKSTSLIGKSRLAAAQMITKKSPVNDMANLIAWYETSLETSFLQSERKNGGFISEWLDSTPEASPRNNAKQQSESSRPRYYKDIFNVGIPAVRFDGINDSMFFDALPLINSGYTIFVVEQRKSNKSSNFFIGGSGADSNSNLYLGYKSNNYLTFGHYLNDLDYGILSFDKPILRIHSFQFSVTGGKKYWLNGGASVDASQPAQIDPISSYPNPAIGRSQIFYYSGEIAEIIIFARALQIGEKELVESYLAKKYNQNIQ